MQRNDVETGREAIDIDKRVHYIELDDDRGRVREGAPETRQWNLIGKSTRREFYRGHVKSRLKGCLMHRFPLSKETCRTIQNNY